MLRFATVALLASAAGAARTGPAELSSEGAEASASSVTTTATRRQLPELQPDVVATEVLIAPAGAPAHLASVSGDLNYLPAGAGSLPSSTATPAASAAAVQAAPAAAAATSAPATEFRTPASVPATRSLDLVALHQEAMEAGRTIFPAAAASPASPPPPPPALRAAPTVAAPASRAAASPFVIAARATPKAAPVSITTTTRAPAASTPASTPAAKPAVPAPASATPVPSPAAASPQPVAAVAAASTSSAEPAPATTVVVILQSSPPPAALAIGASASTLYTPDHPHAFGLQGSAFWAVLFAILIACTAITAFVIFRIREKHGLLLPPLRGRRHRNGPNDPRHWMDYEDEDVEYGATKQHSARAGLAAASGQSRGNGFGFPGQGWGHQNGPAGGGWAPGDGPTPRRDGGAGGSGDLGRGSGGSLARASGDSRQHGSRRNHHNGHHHHGGGSGGDLGRSSGHRRDRDRDRGRDGGGGGGGGLQRDSGGAGSWSEGGSSEGDWGEADPSRRRRGRRARRTRREREAEEQGLATLRRGKQEKAPPWEEMYKQAPEACTQNAKGLMDDLRHGRKVLCERSWKGEVGSFRTGGANLLKVCIWQERRGVLVTFGEKLLGPTKHVLERAFTKVDSVAIHLETEKGLAILHPGDLASRATWILAVNSCFHKHAIDTNRKWGIGDADLDGPAIGLPWHPNVTLEPRDEEPHALPPPGGAPGSATRRKGAGGLERPSGGGQSARGGRGGLAAASGGSRGRRGGVGGDAAEFWQEDGESSSEESDGAGGGRRQQRGARMARPTTPD